MAATARVQWAIQSSKLASPNYMQGVIYQIRAAGYFAGCEVVIGVEPRLQLKSMCWLWEAANRTVQSYIALVFEHGPWTMIADNIVLASPVWPLERIA